MLISHFILSDAENTQQIVQFGLMVLEELRKGNSAASSGDLHLKRLSVNKLTFHSSILSRIMEVTINKELKVELTRLITCTSQFLESNRITGYSMVETAPVGPGLLGMERRWCPNSEVREQGGAAGNTTAKSENKG